MQFLEAQRDFIVFLNGFLFLVLAAFSLFARLSRPSRLAWGWLVPAGAAAGVAEWLQIPLWFGVTQAQPLRLAALIAAYFGLLAFAVNSHVWEKRPLVPRWTTIFAATPPIVAAFLDLDTAFLVLKVFLSVPAFVLAVVAILRIIRMPPKPAPEEITVLRLLAAVTLAYAAVMMGTAAGEFALHLAACRPGLPEVAAGVLLAVQPLRVVLLLGLTVLMWCHLKQRRSQEDVVHGLHLFRNSRFFFATLMLILLGGWGFTHHLGAGFERRKEEFLRQQTITTAAMLPTEDVAALKGAPEDADAPAYRLLKQHFIDAREHNRDLGAIYLVAKRGGNLVILVNSDPPGSPGAAPSGRRYDAPHAAVWDHCRAGKSCVNGPYTDQRGAWVTAYTPVRNAAAHEVVAMLGMDVSAAAWKKDVAMYRLIGITATLGVALILVASFLIVQNVHETNSRIAASERRYRTIVESVNDAITIHDLATGDLLEVNRRALEMVGLPPGGDGISPVAAPSLLPFSAHQPPYDRDHADDRIRRAAKGEEQLFEWLAHDVGGRTFWVDVALRRIAIGGRSCLLTVVRDINARKKAEAALQQSQADLEQRIRERTAELEKANAALTTDIEARKNIETKLRESEGRFRILAETNQTGIIILQGDNFAYVNPGFERITGYPRDELLRMRAWDLIHPEQREMFRQNVLSRIRGERPPGQFEAKVLTRGGGERWIFINIGTIAFKGALASLATVLDVTEQRHIEEERQQLALRSLHAHKLETLGAMAGGIAHDFNNLLMSITGNADILLSGLPANSEHARTVEEIRRAARSAANISDKMLAYSGRGSLTCQPADLAAFLRDMRPFLVNFSSTLIDIAFDIPAHLPELRADLNQIRQIIVNLVTNAAEAIGENRGTIAIKAGERALGKAEISAMVPGMEAPPGRFVFLSISDTGRGVDKGMLTRLFDPFFTTKFVGRGLGLSAVLGMVRSHRGLIDVASDAAKGTTVTVFLPIPATEAPAPTSAAEPAPEPATPPPSAAPAAAAPAAPAAPATGSGRMPVVMVVDDEASLLNIVRIYLERNGLGVVTAPGGAEALALIRKNRNCADLVILDLTMPGMNGDEVFAELQRLTPGLPVILSSGYSESDATAAFDRSHLAGFLKKPYQLRDLLALARKVLGKRAPAP